MTYDDGIPPHIGTPATGARRYSRPELEALFDQAVSVGSCGALVQGHRRTGKSTEVIACGERLAGRNRILIQVNAEGMTSEFELLRYIFSQLPLRNFRDRYLRIVTDGHVIVQSWRSLLEGLSRGRMGQPEAYLPQLREAIERAMHQMADRPVLIVDEFPCLCRNIMTAGSDRKARQTRVNTLLADLHRWRALGMAMLLTGSIGFMSLVRQYRLDREHVNDLKEIEVPPLTEVEALEFIPALIRGGRVQGWTADHTLSFMRELPALYPSIIQWALPYLTRAGQACELAELPDIFADTVRPDLENAFYAQFSRRLEDYQRLPAPLNHLTRDILGLVLPAQAPLSRAEIRAGLTAEIREYDLSAALTLLREDGFLAVRRPADGGCCWRPSSSLVVTWWHLCY